MCISSVPTASLAMLFASARLHAFSECGRLAKRKPNWLSRFLGFNANTATQSSGIRILKDAARRLPLWKPFLLNWYKHQISTTKLEATDRKIGLLQRNACGYRDEQYLKLRIYNIHTATYALTGGARYQ